MARPGGDTQTLDPSPPTPATADLFLTATLVFAVLVGIALRVWILASPLGTADSDEAVVGLMARHFLDGDVSAFFWGQTYGGVQEPALAAALFAVVGSSVLALKVVPLALGVATTLLVWAIGRHTIGERGARIAAALSWAGSIVSIWMSTKERGFYGVVNVAGLVVVLMAIRLRQRASWPDAAILGLAVGTGWYASPQIAYVTLPCLGWLGFVAMRERRADLLRLSWLAAGGALIAASPWLVANFGNDLASLKPPLDVVHTSYLERLQGLFDTGLPLLIGLKVPFGGHWLVPVVAAAAYAGALAGLGHVIFRYRDRNIAVLVVIAAAYPFVVAIPSASWYMLVPRYLLYLWPILALLAARAIISLKERTQVIPILAIVALAVFGLGSVSNWSDAHPGNDDLSPAELGPLLEALSQEGVQTAFAEYWVAYRINFETKEAVTAASLGQVRYAPYQERVRASARPAYVLLKGSSHDERIGKGLRELAVPHRRMVAGGFIVYFPDSTVLPEAIPGG